MICSVVRSDFAEDSDGRGNLPNAVRQPSADPSLVCFRVLQVVHGVFERDLLDSPQRIASAHWPPELRSNGAALHLNRAHSRKCTVPCQGAPTSQRAEVNPLAGCLPSLIQIPVVLGVYYAVPAG